MFKFDVLSRWSGKVQFTADIDYSSDALSSVKLGMAVKWALSNGADLTDTDLRGADLTDADLRDANLRGADLTDADLRDANLRDANLRGADLTDANLRDANLTDADLRDANLRGADLTDANLRDANLRDANLRDAKNFQGYAYFGPVGVEARYGCAKIVDGETIVHLGCHSGSLADTCKAIQEKYGQNSTYEALVRAAVAEMEFSQSKREEAA